MIEKMKDPLVLYLEKPDDTVLGSINDILDEGSSSLSVALNQHYELELTANNTADSLSWYDYIQEGMYVLIGGIGHFKLFHPSISTDGVHETKTVSGQSCDVELEDKTCSYSVNMGEETSLEYLVTYDEDEAEALLNPYTGIPYDWIVLYNTFPEQLEAVKTKYNQGYYGTADSSGEITVTSSTLITELTDLFTLIPRLKNKLTEADGETTLTEYVVFSYDGDSTTVTSITLTSAFLSRVETLITFYEKYRDQLSLLSIILAETDGNWTLGEIYGVSDGDYTLANKKYQFEIDETAYAFLTQTFARTSKCLVAFDILNRKVNVIPAEQIGKDTGIVLSYDNLLNSLEITNDEDSLSTRFYVSGGDGLGIEQVNFGRSYIDALDYKLNVKGKDGKRYYVSDELAEKYATYSSGLETKREQYIQYSKDYSSYSAEIDELKYRVPNDDLTTDWGTFTEEELEESLTSYKNLLATLLTLYREDYGDSYFNDDGTPDENHIKTTIYWWDYRAYVSIIDEIECAISTYPYYSDQDKWSDENLETYKNLITSWETEWSLYGTVELQAKIDSYTSNMKLLAGQSVEVDSSTDTPIAWGDLTDDQKEKYNNLETNYQYDTYKEYYDLRASAQEYLDELNAQLDTLKSELKTTQVARTELVNSTSWESNFTEDECKILNRLIRDSSYENENILVTSINTTGEKIDIMSDLLADAQDVAFSYSRPQLSFSASADNLLATEKFKPLWKDFAVGNYMLVQLEDNSYVKLRMTEYSFNPTLPASDNFSLSFSTYIRSRSQVTDIERLLGVSSSSGGSSSGSSSGGSGSSDYGSSDDIDVTISNTMLSKLLNTETFGTRVKDIILNTIDVNSITARYATFNNLKDGQTVISGSNILTGKIESKYIQTNGLQAVDSNGNNTFYIDEDGEVTINATSLSLSGKDVSELGKIATNYISYTSGSGLIIGNYVNGTLSGECVQIASGSITVGLTNAWEYNTYITSGGIQLRYGTTSYTTITSGAVTIGESSGFNTYIDSDSVDIRSGTTVLASFGADAIYLGKNLASSKIDLCNGSGSIYTKNGGFYIGVADEDSWDALHLKGGKTSGVVMDKASIAVLNGEYVYASNGFRIGSSSSVNDDDTLSYITESGCYFGPEVTFHNNVWVTGNIFSGGSESGEARTGAISRLGSVYVLSKSGSGMGVYAYTTDKAYSKWLVYMNSSGEIRSADAGVLIGSDNYSDYLNNWLTVKVDETLATVASKYMPRSGGTFSGEVTISGNLTLGTNSKISLNGGSYHVTYGNGLYDDTIGWLVASYTSNDRQLTRLGNTSYPVSIYTSTNVWKNGSTSTYFATTSSSDSRLKEEVSGMSRYETFFDHLKPIAFRYHEGVYNAPGHDPLIQWGFYAQDTIKAFDAAGLDWMQEELVVVEDGELSEEELKYAPSGLLKMNYQNLMALNTHMIQISRSEIDELKEQNQQLKLQIEDLALEIVTLKQNMEENHA